MTSYQWNQLSFLQLLPLKTILKNFQNQKLNLERNVEIELFGRYFVYSITKDIWIYKLSLCSVCTCTGMIRKAEQNKNNIFVNDTAKTGSHECFSWKNWQKYCFFWCFKLNCTSLNQLALSETETNVIRTWCFFAIFHVSKCIIIDLVSDLG